MKAHFLKSRHALVASLAAAATLLAAPGHAQTSASDDDSASLNREFASDMQDSRLGISSQLVDNAGVDPMQQGTIPAARPGLPQTQTGAMGPIRWDELRQSRTDPSIRDTYPLTVNGVWEQHFGNVVTPSYEHAAGGKRLPNAG